MVLPSSPSNTPPFRNPDNEDIQQDLLLQDGPVMSYRREIQPYASRDRQDGFAHLDRTTHYGGSQSGDEPESEEDGDAEISEAEHAVRQTYREPDNREEDMGFLLVDHLSQSSTDGESDDTVASTGSFTERYVAQYRASRSRLLALRKGSPGSAPRVSETEDSAAISVDLPVGIAGGG